MSLDYLYEHLLEWDLSKLKHEHPRSARSEDALDKYKSSFEYVRIMEPLNLLECYASIRQVFAEFRDQEKARRFGGFRFKVQATKEGDDNELFTEICMGATQQELEEHELFSSTLVVITVPGSGKAKCLGKISEIVWNKKTREMDVWIRTRRADLREGSLWECCYLTNMATAERELLALLSIGDFALKNDILFGQCYSFPKGPDSEIQRLQDKYIGKLNRSQAQAVYGSLNTRGGFSLIQGPPGTGKTSTIVSIIRELLESGSRPLMFCAPSNAAVDELTKRLKKHFLDEKLDYKILRIGRPENVHTEVAHLTLGGMISASSDQEATKKAECDALTLILRPLEKEMDILYKSKDSLFNKLNLLFKSSGSTVQDSINSTKSKLTTVKKDIDGLRSQVMELRTKIWLIRNQIKTNRAQRIAKILKQSDVFCCTLSGSASTDVQRCGRLFPTVIIDEAGQCTEPSVLIPLQYRCTKVILVGDPKQLPPTVLSTEAGNFDYDKSLFVRMLKAHPDAMHILDTQYRMHTNISLFPRAIFYDNVLKDAPGMELKTARKWHSTEHLPPYMFFNVEGKHKFGDNHSFYNTAEIQFANKLVSAVLKCVGAGKKLDIGIVSPYKQQVEKLRHHFEQRYDTGKETMTLEIQTVDSLQGREKDIIFMSCVRAHPTAQTVGFLADVRRMNVAITRAKASLWIIGNADTLVSNEKWESLLRNANERNVYYEASDFHTREGVYMDNLGISLEALSLE